VVHWLGQSRGPLPAQTTCAEAPEARGTMPNRVNGCSPPYNMKQAIFVGMSAVLTILFSSLVYHFSTSRSEEVPLPHHGLYIALVYPYIAATIFGTFCWAYITVTDPSEQTCFGNCLPDDDPKWTVPQYVREHNRRIPGRDHFCPWLNVAIGRANYIPFFVLTVCGVIESFIQVIFCSLLLTLWHDCLVSRVNTATDPRGLVFQVLIVITIFMAVAFGISYTMLLQFHILLISTHESTYSYYIKAQKAYREQQLGIASEPHQEEPAPLLQSTFPQAEPLHDSYGATETGEFPGSESASPFDSGSGGHSGQVEVELAPVSSSSSGSRGRLPVAVQ